MRWVPSNHSQALMRGTFFANGPPCGLPFILSKNACALRLMLVLTFASLSAFCAALSKTKSLPGRRLSFITCYV